MEMRSASLRGNPRMAQAPPCNRKNNRKLSAPPFGSLRRPPLGSLRRPHWSEITIKRSVQREARHGLQFCYFEPRAGCHAACHIRNHIALCRHTHFSLQSDHILHETGFEFTSYAATNVTVVCAKDSAIHIHSLDSRPPLRFAFEDGCGPVTA